MAEVKTKNTEAKILSVMQEAVGIIDDHADKKKASLVMHSLKALYPGLEIPASVAPPMGLDDFIKKYNPKPKEAIPPFQSTGGLWGPVIQAMGRTCRGCGQ